MKKYLLFFLIVFNSISFPQISEFGIGAGLGLGSIKGNLPSQTALNGGLVFEFPSIFDDFYSFQLSIQYAQKVERFLPENRIGRYYPFIKFITLKPVIRQFFNNNFYTEEGLGLVYLNDRTYSDYDTWNYGMSLHLLGGININNSFDLGLKIDYGLTFNNTTASYFLVTAQGVYKFQL